MCPRGRGVHFSGSDGAVSASFLHLLLNELIGINEVLAHAFHVDAECLVLSDLVSFLGTLGDWDKEVLHLLVVDLHHGDLHLVLLIRVIVLGDPRKDLLA